MLYVLIAFIIACVHCFLVVLCYVHDSGFSLCLYCVVCVVFGCVCDFGCCSWLCVVWLFVVLSCCVCMVCVCFVFCCVRVCRVVVHVSCVVFPCL